MKRIFAGFLLASVGSALALVLVEITLRATYPEMAIFTRHERLGLVNLPNLDGRLTFGGHERVVRITTNSIGLRASEIPMTKARGVRRVVALGDSFTFGNSVEQDEAWPQELEKRLNERQGTVRYEVINAGVSTYGTGQELLLYQMLAGRLQADLVVLGFDVVNDLLDNLCIEEADFRPKSTIPCFTMGGDGLAVRWPRKPQNQSPASPRSRLLRLRAAEFFVVQLKRLTVWNPGIVGLLQRVGVPVKLPHVPGTVASWYDARFSESGWTLTRQLFLKLRSVLESRGVPLLVLIIPSSLQVDRGRQEAVRLLGRDQRPIQDFFSDPTRPQRLLHEFCAEAKLECVDPLPALLEAQARGESLYYPVDGHWTPIAHRIAAGLVAQRLRTSTLWQATHTVGHGF